MSFNLFIHAGGYWSTDDQYLGREPHTVGLVSAETFKLSSVLMLVVVHLGNEDNMKKVSWFLPETHEEKEDIDNDNVLKKVVHYAVGSEFSKCATVENNLRESFNTAIQIARTKPIVEMLEEKRKRVMVNNDKKRSEADKTKGEYTPKSIALLDQQIDLAKNCRSLSCGLGNYEVGYFNYKTNMRIESFVVQMRGDIQCSCRMYLINGIPCSHIVSCLRHEKNTDQDPKKLISSWFTTEKLKTCYKDGLCGVNGMNLWEMTTNVRVIPHVYKRPGGRPLGKKRKREKGEPREVTKFSKKRTKIHCGICGQEGHNKHKCKNAPMPKAPKKPPGRPKTPFVLRSES